jgi:hypothetical protein
MADGSIHRPELKLFELKNGVQIPNLHEAWANPGHMCTGTRVRMPCDTAGFVGSGAGCGRSRSNLSKDSRPKWRFCCKIGAPARSPHPLAPTHPPLQCAAPQTRNQPSGTAALSTRRERVAMHRRLCRTGSRSRLCAVVRTSAAEFRRHGAQQELKPLARDAHNQGARGRAAHARCNPQDATRQCPARLDSIQRAKRRQQY